MKILYAALFSLILSPCLLAQQQTTGLFHYTPEAFPGYTLFNPIRSTTTYLIDNCGREVHRWEGPYTPGNSAYLLENGLLLRTAKTSLEANPVFQIGGAGERVQLVDWQGEVLWEYILSDSVARLHHDIEPLPGGNVLVLAWELKTEAEALAAGRRPDLLPDGAVWSEQILEVVPYTGEVVWEWHLWDHLVQDEDPAAENYGVVGEHPGLLDLNFTGGATAGGGADWIHANALDYNPERDEILFNSPFTGELYVIDHSTTTEEAAGHRGGRRDRGGDFLYRWGNPQAYDQGTADDQQLFGAHDAHWIEAGLEDAGKVMVFNNGNARRPYSSVDIFQPPVDDYLNGSYVYVPNTAYLPRRPDYRYTADPPESFFSDFLSGAQRLPSGNTLIAAGAQGRIFEINPQEEIVWDYVSPAIDEGTIGRSEEIPILAGRNANILFRAIRYPPDYPGLAGRDLTPGDPLEQDFPQPYECELLTDVEPVLLRDLRVFPVPAADVLVVAHPDAAGRRLRIWDSLGRLWREEVPDGPRFELDLAGWPAGIYWLQMEGAAGQRIVIM